MGGAAYSEIIPSRTAHYFFYRLSELAVCGIGPVCDARSEVIDVIRCENDLRLRIEPAVGVGHKCYGRTLPVSFVGPNAIMPPAQFPY